MYYYFEKNNTKNTVLNDHTELPWFQVIKSKAQTDNGYYYVNSGTGHSTRPKSFFS